MHDLSFRWLFFVEGSITVVVAIAAIFILPDFPENTSGWLTPAEQAVAVQRMIEDAGADQEVGRESTEFTEETENPKFHSSKVGLFMALEDWKVWWSALAIGTMSTALSFNAYFPTLVATMGYSTTKTLLLCTPPWILATALALIISRCILLSTLDRILYLAMSRHSDRNGERYWHIAVPYLVGILGYLTAITTLSTGFRYFSL